MMSVSSVYSGILGKDPKKLRVSRSRLRAVSGLSVSGDPESRVQRKFKGGHTSTLDQSAISSCSTHDHRVSTCSTYRTPSIFYAPKDLM